MTDTPNHHERLAPDAQISAPSSFPVRDSAGAIVGEARYLGDGKISAVFTEDFRDKVLSLPRPAFSSLAFGAARDQLLEQADASRGDRDAADALAAELRSADPQPHLERARALAEYAQHSRHASKGEEERFAWATFNEAGGHSLGPWAAFQAGLAAQVEWLSRGV